MSQPDAQTLLWHSKDPQPPVVVTNASFTGDNQRHGPLSLQRGQTQEEKKLAMIFNIGNNLKSQVFRFLLVLMEKLEEKDAWERSRAAVWSPGGGLAPHLLLCLT